MEFKRRFKNVGVLMGGSSEENQISLESGRAVCSALKDKGYKAISLVVKDKNEALYLLRRIEIDCVFIALHGGFGEDGTIQKILDEIKMPYTGSGYKASLAAMDKIESKKILRSNNLPTPDYKVLKDNEFPVTFNGLGLPLAIKPSSQGSSVGLSIIEEESLLTVALKYAYKFNSYIIVEKYIKGREITVGILDDKPLPVLEIVPKRKFYDYKAKYTKGLTEYLVPAPIDKAIYLKAQEVALKAHKALNCHYFSRVDMRLGEDGEIFILEINTIPGLTLHSLLPKAAEAEGISFGDLCENILNVASYAKDD